VIDGAPGDETEACRAQVRYSVQSCVIIQISGRKILPVSSG